MNPKNMKDILNPDFYSSHSLISDKAYYETKSAENYRVCHPTYINWWQIWCGFWIVFFLLFSVLAMTFGIIVILYITLPLMGWNYLIGFSKFWPRLYQRNKFRFWYIQRDFADEMQMLYSFRQRISDWGEKNYIKYKEEKGKRPKPTPRAKEPKVPKPPRPKRSSRFSRWWEKRKEKSRIKNTQSKKNAPPYNGTKRELGHPHRGEHMPLPVVRDIDPVHGEPEARTQREDFI